MNSATLIGIAIMTGVVAIAALTINRWVEQRRIERMRQAVLHSETMIRAAYQGETLLPWLSADSLRFLADVIQHHALFLNTLAASQNPRSDRAKVLAEEWLNNTPPPSRVGMPRQLKEVKKLRNALIDFLQMVKEAHQERLTSTQNAKDRIKEARTLNVRICVSAYQARAKTALLQESPNQALHFMKRAQVSLSTIEDLPEDLQTELDSLGTAIAELEKLRAEANTSSRLAEGAEQLVEDEESWKKKNYD